MTTATTGPKYPDCKVQLTGTDANAFFLASRVRKALVRHLREQVEDAELEGLERVEALRAAEAEGEAFFTEALSGDYDYVIETCLAWVDAS